MENSQYKYTQQEVGDCEPPTYAHEQLKGMQIPKEEPMPAAEEMLYKSRDYFDATAIGHAALHAIQEGTGFITIPTEEPMKLLTCLQKLKGIYPEIVIADFDKDPIGMVAKRKIDLAIESEEKDLKILSETSLSKLKAWNSVEFSLIEAEEEFVDGERYQFVIFMHDNDDGEEVKIPFYIEDGNHSAPMSRYVVPYNLKNEFVCLEMSDEVANETA